MAEVLSISDAYNTVSLIDTSGFEVLSDGWRPARAVDPHTPVIETMRVKLTTTSNDNFASQLRTLNRLFVYANQYGTNETQEDEVYLNAQLSGETEQRRSILLGGSYKFDKDIAEPISRNFDVYFLTLALRRMPYWEQTGSDGATTLALNCLAGNIVVTTGVVGDMPARLSIAVAQDTGGPVETLWAGIRSDRRHGNATSFHPKWECEIGTAGTDTATSTAEDANTSGSSPKIMRCTFSTSTALVERVRVLASEVGDPASQYGRFLVLARLQLTAAGTVRVRLQSGWYSALVTPNYKVGDLVTITSIFWKVYELGIVKFPPFHGNGINAASMNNAALSLLAERTSGSTSFDMDTFILIPIDEGFAKLSGTSLTASTEVAQIGVSPLNKVITGFSSSGNFQKYVEFSQQNFFLPTETTRVYFVGERASFQDIDDTIDVSYTARNRFYNLRGSFAP